MTIRRTLSGSCTVPLAPEESAVASLIAAHGGDSTFPLWCSVGFGLPAGASASSWADIRGGSFPAFATLGTAPVIVGTGLSKVLRFNGTSDGLSSTLDLTGLSAVYIVASSRSAGSYFEAVQGGGMMGLKGLAVDEGGFYLKPGLVFVYSNASKNATANSIEDRAQTRRIRLLAATHEGAGVLAMRGPYGSKRTTGTGLTIPNGAGGTIALGRNAGGNYAAIDVTAIIAIKGVTGASLATIETDLIAYARDYRGSMTGLSKRIAPIGDSTTNGLDCPTTVADNYPMQLIERAEFADWDEITAGYGGQGTATIFSNLSTIIAAIKAGSPGRAVAVLDIGTNDGAGITGVAPTPRVSADNVWQIADQLRTNGIEVVLVPMKPRTSIFGNGQTASGFETWRTGLHTIYDAEWPSHANYFINRANYSSIFAAGASTGPLYADGTHPNKDGYAVVAQAVAQTLFP